MKPYRAIVVAVLVVAFVESVTACFNETYVTPAKDEQREPEASPDGGPGGLGAQSKPSALTEASCKGAFIKPDLTKLTACGGGKGHCYDGAKTPGASSFMPCANPSEVCVPDAVLTAGGSRLKTCSSFSGMPGGCMTLDLINMPAADKEQSKVLPQDVCAAGEICAPCTDPRTSTPTPACEPMGVFAEPCKDASPQSAADAGAPNAAGATCCVSGGKAAGTCIAEAALASAQQGDAPQDTCQAGTVCVPAAWVSGKPVGCTAGRLLGPGVCLDDCFSTAMRIGGVLFGNEGCGSTETCVPCALLSGKGVPGCE
jgi:hypothetical protein